MRVGTWGQGRLFAACYWVLVTLRGQAPVLCPPFPNPRDSARCAFCRCQSLLERRMDEDGERGALSVSLKVMSEVHQRYFAEGVCVWCAGMQRRLL